MAHAETDFIATSISIADRMIHLNLLDGSAHTFPVSYYPILAAASDEELQNVVLRVGGRALRWESLDEDIWIRDAILQRYPRPGVLAVAEPGPGWEGSVG